MDNSEKGGYKTLKGFLGAKRIKEYAAKSAAAAQDKKERIKLYRQEKNAKKKAAKAIDNVLPLSPIKIVEENNMDAEDLNLCDNVIAVNYKSILLALSTNPRATRLDIVHSMVAAATASVGQTVCKRSIIDPNRKDMCAKSDVDFINATPQSHRQLAESLTQTFPEERTGRWFQKGFGRKRTGPAMYKTVMVWNFVLALYDRGLAVNGGVKTLPHIAAKAMYHKGTLDGANLISTSDADRLLMQPNQHGIREFKIHECLSSDQFKAEFGKKREQLIYARNNAEELVQQQQLNLEDPERESIFKADKKKLLIKVNAFMRPYLEIDNVEDVQNNDAHNEDNKLNDDDDEDSDDEIEDINPDRRVILLNLWRDKETLSLSVLRTRFYELIQLYR